MHLKGKNLSEVSFPAGGIGAGCIGINGIGELSDWEIFNQPGKFQRNGCSHFSIRAEQDGKVKDVRILNGPRRHNLSGDHGDPNQLWCEFGWGPDPNTFCGFPRFRSCEMTGEFPAAQYDFTEKDFPGKVSLCVWSPFVPGDSDLSSLPCAVFEFTVRNTSKRKTVFTLTGVLQNRWAPGKNAVSRKNGITSLSLRNTCKKTLPEYGELALSTDAEEVSFQEYLFRGGWCDRREVYAHDLFTPGPFRNRRYEEPGKSADAGLLAAHAELAPGESRTFRFLLSWYVPNRTNDWSDPAALKEKMKNSGVRKNLWKNYYTHLCRSAVHAAEQIFRSFETIRNNVFLFRKALHDSDLPETILQGVAANLAVLVSPTCLRLEDGTLWGWEGVAMRKGLCPGSCQHVWNYAQAIPLLFPDLERSLRESHFRYGMDPEGRLHFRLELPLGVREKPDSRPCADGTFGEIMKVFREWKISGDTAWLRSLWPNIRKVLEFVWSSRNRDLWDPEKSGLLTGRQHHTLDMELFGPSGWLEGHYLGALKAASVMADAYGDTLFASECRKIFRRGKAKAEKQLFNGEYYAQKIDLTDREILRKHQAEEAYWDAEHGEIKYQIGDGCSIDAHLGQWYATLYGIGDIFDRERVRSTLKSIYRYNFRKSQLKTVNTWRVFSLNEEGGTQICTWPKAGTKPVIPLPYHSETMTGFEWAAASHCILIGERRIGEIMAKAVRGRFNGENRNPWNEFECGSNYARSMASFAMLQSYSGFSCDMTEGRITFSPVVTGNFRCFWSIGKVWGTYERTGKQQTLRILYGSARFRKFALGAKRLLRNGKAVPARRTGNVLQAELSVQTGDELVFL